MILWRRRDSQNMDIWDLMPMRIVSRLTLVVLVALYLISPTSFNRTVVEIVTGVSSQIEEQMTPLIEDVVQRATDSS